MPITHSICFVLLRIFRGLVPFLSFHCIAPDTCIMHVQCSQWQLFLCHFRLFCSDKSGRSFCILDIIYQCYHRQRLQYQPFLFTHLSWQKHLLNEIGNSTQHQYFWNWNQNKRWMKNIDQCLYTTTMIWMNGKSLSHQSVYHSRILTFVLENLHLFGFFI